MKETKETKFCEECMAHYTGVHKCGWLMKFLVQAAKKRWKILNSLTLQMRLNN